MGAMKAARAFAKRLLPLSAIKFIERYVDALPDRVGKLLNPPKYADLPAGPARPLLVGAGTARLVVGPLNTAGQAYHWAHAVELRTEHAALSLVVDSPDGFGFAAHRVVPQLRADRSSDWQRAEFRAIVSQATHVLIESAQPLFGPLFGRDIERQTRALHNHGVRVAIVAHGSDVRDVEAHRAREPHSPYGDPQLVPEAAELDASAACTRAAIARLGVPLFGSTPGVQFDLPTAVWLPVVVDPDGWAADFAPLDSAVPVVVHAPSRAGLKGSEVADDVLGRLHREGLIEYRRLDHASHSEVRVAYRAADIVVDSLRMGGYGVGACEAMAAGRLVLSHVNLHARLAVEAVMGEQPPIWPADVGTLEVAVRAVLADREAARALAARGPAFVRLAHDGRASATVLESFLGS